MRLGIDIGVGGRFHADRLAGTLLHLGHDICVWSTFPRSRFPSLSTEQFAPDLLPEIFYRTMRGIGAENLGDIAKMQLFGQRLARRIQKSPRENLFIGWSSFSLETLRLKQHHHRAIIRDSAHLRRQLDILSQENARFGVRTQNRHIALAREEEEYLLADTIFVLSRFARDSFIECGVPAEKLHLLPLGADTQLFAPVSRDHYALPLKVIYFGSVSVRKGVRYLLEATERFDPSQIELTVLGPVEPALRATVAKYPNVIFKPAVPQPVLARLLPDYDIFVLPTLEDGFGQTLVQAMASGLIPLSTDRSGASECIRDGVNGRVVPAGNAAAIEGVLAEWVANPQALMPLREAVVNGLSDLGWGAYERAVSEWLTQGESHGRF